MPRETVGHTLVVALLLCLVCSVFVSGAAVGLRSRQEENNRREVQANILLAAGVLTPETVSDEAVAALSDRVESRLVALGEGGGEVDPASVGIDLKNYEARKSAKDPLLSIEIPGEMDLAGIRRREKYAPVFLVKGEQGKVETVVLPIYGKGLWSTLYGFLALDYQDLNTVRGITFYEHGETPGLGGEVDNDAWKAQWQGKQVYNPDYDVQISVVKGGVSPEETIAIHQVDGLSGATITSRGVENLVEYWLGEDGFGSYLQQLRVQPVAGREGR